MTDDIKIRYTTDLTSIDIDEIASQKELYSLLLQNHGIDKKGFEFFKEASYAAELHICDNYIIKLIEHWAGAGVWDDEREEYRKEIVHECHVELPTNNWEDRSPFFLVKDKKGKHQVGGEPPDYFKMPKHEKMFFPMQYLCRIDCSDPKFQWMAIPELNIVAPLYDYFSELYLDYSDVNKPKILNPECFEEPEPFDPHMKIDGNVIFKKFNLKSADNDEPSKFAEMYEEDDLILCGVLNLDQDFVLPKCPVTNKYMKFVCKIPSDSKIKIENLDSHTNLISPDEHLDFGDGGYLYVYFHPESKIAHIELVCS